MNAAHPNRRRASLPCLCLPLAAVAVLSLVRPTAGLGDEPLLTQTDVFPAGMDGVTLYRIPGIVVTGEGTLLAYCEARRNTRADWGEIEVHLRRSTDGGKTWQPPQHIAHRGRRIEGNPHKPGDGDREQTVNNPVAMVDRESGEIVMLYCVNYAVCFAMRSVDDGKTWSDPVEITATFEPFRNEYDWKVIAAGPGHGIQLKTGRMVVPIWLAYGGVGAHKPSASGTIYSDNAGKSWQAGEVAFPDTDRFVTPSETIAAELSDGRVLLIARNISPPNRKLVTTGPDGAGRWETPQFHPELLEPVCMAGLVADPNHPGTLLFSNPHTVAVNADGNEVPRGRGKRENLAIKLSDDNGRSWPISKTLEPGPSAYSDLVVLSDGTFGCLYEGSNRIRFARFNLEWLKSP